MKKFISVIIITAVLIFGSFWMVFAAFPSSYTNWTSGTVITSAWLNALEQSIISTTSTIGSIFNQATTTGNMLVASSSSGWKILTVGANAKCLTASSTATTGVS